MAVFRIEKTRDYTVMSNHHLKDRTLTLKSKGLLSMMLSLPDEWNYTTRGLAAICREGVDSIGAALKELETHGYIRRTQLRDEKGKITDTEYVIYEMPQCEPPSSPGTPLPGTAKPYTENPDMGIPDTAKPCTETPAQLNTNQTKTDLSSTELSNPIQSNPPTPAGARMGTDRMGARECYREVILDNIEYSYLVQDSHMDPSHEELLKVPLSMVHHQFRSLLFSRKMPAIQLRFGEHQYFHSMPKCPSLELFGTPSFHLLLSYSRTQRLLTRRLEHCYQSRHIS